MLNLVHLNSYFISNKLHAELAVKLDTAGIQQKIYVPVGKSTDLGKNKPDNLIASELVYDYCFTQLDRLLWPNKMRKIWSSFQRNIQLKSADIVHAHTLFVNGLIAYMAYRKFKVPYIVTIRNTDVNLFLKIPLFKYLALRILKSASAIITVSPSYLEILRTKLLDDQKYHHIMARCRVVPNGINDYWIENRRECVAMQPVHTVLFSGRIDKNKNLSSLIKACELLHDRGIPVQLNVMGDGPLLHKFKQRSYKFPIQFFGFLDCKERIVEVLRQSDLLVVPSVKETFGLVYPEAMSQGLPVIYTRGQGFDGQFPDGYVGFAVDPFDINGIANKILAAFKDYSRLSKNAYQASLAFSWDGITSQLIDVYTEVMEGRS